MYSLLSRSLLILFLGCCSFSSQAEPLNSSLLKKEIRKYHDSGEYEQELTKQIMLAQGYILQQAQQYKEKKVTKKLALVLDIDETSITNYDKIVQRDFAGDAQQIHQEILAGNSPAIKATLNLFNTAKKNGIDVFFVTGRVKSELPATEKNLTYAGYKDWSGIYVKPSNYTNKSVIAFKAASRKKIEEQGYIILASIGDQYSDVKGGYALKGFKLPNPFYYIP